MRVSDRIAFFVPGVVWMNTHPNLASRVCAGCPSLLPCRPPVSFFTTGIQVPSTCTYKIGTGWPSTIGRSNCMARWISSCSRCAMSPPIASAVRSTALVVTSKPARVCICCGRDRTVRPIPPPPTCAARRARPRCPAHPIPHRRETVPGGNASTGSRDNIFAPRPPR
jgi:hypothetical protein